MLKSMILASVLASGLGLGTNALAHEYNDDGYHQPHYLGNPGGVFEIRVVPPLHRPVERCLRGSRVDELQAEQSSLINAGYRDGDLTGSEMDRLLGQQDHIARLEQRMRADRCLTVSERDDLMLRLEQAARNIWQARNNDERRRRHHGGWHNGDWHYNTRH